MGGGGLGGVLPLTHLKEHLPMSALKEAFAHSETLIGTGVGVSDWITGIKENDRPIPPTTHDMQWIPHRPRTPRRGNALWRDHRARVS